MVEYDYHPPKKGIMESIVRLSCGYWADRQNAVKKKEERGTYGQRYMGNPCKRGHSGERYILNDACVECEAARRLNNSMRRINGGVAETVHGNPCIRGHDGTRYKRNNVCVRCTKERSEQRRLKNIEKRKANETENPVL